MSEYESLRTDLEAMHRSILDYAEAVGKHAAAVDEATQALWADNAELRDELHAVANRLENLTTFVTTSPAEVAAAIVNDANQATAAIVVNDELRKRKDRWGA